MAAPALSLRELLTAEGLLDDGASREELHEGGDGSEAVVTEKLNFTMWN